MLAHAIWEFASLFSALGDRKKSRRSSCSKLAFFCFKMTLLQFVPGHAKFIRCDCVSENVFRLAWVCKTRLLVTTFFLKDDCGQSADAHLFLLATYIKSIKRMNTIIRRANRANRISWASLLSFWLSFGGFLSLASAARTLFLTIKSHFLYLIFC